MWEDGKVSFAGKKIPVYQQHVSIRKKIYTKLTKWRGFRNNDGSVADDIFGKKLMDQEIFGDRIHETW